MASRPNRRLVWRLAAGLIGVPLALVAAGAVNAGAGDPATVQVMQTGALTVQASGSWTWAEMATATKLSYAGFALDWGDVATGNEVPKPGGGNYHIGDGTATTNVVMHPTSPAQGVAGTWGPVSHTYAQSGTYMVCAIFYDLGEVTPFKASGYHGLTAGGTDRNTDNSAEQNSVGSTSCVSVDVVVPTATPTIPATPAPTASPTIPATPAPTASPTPVQTVEGATSSPSPVQTVEGATSSPSPVQTVEGATSQPSGTPPVTSTLPINRPDNGNALPFALLVLFAGSGLFTALAVKPIRENRRENRR